MTNTLLSVHYAKITDAWFAEHVETYVDCLNRVDRLRFENMKNAKKRKQLLLSRVLIQQVIKKMIGQEIIHYKIIQYSQLVVNDRYQFSLSITHSGEIAAIALADESLCVGIDIEKVKPRDVTALSKEFCTSKELERIASTSDQSQLINFYKLWTAKESLTKATDSNLYQLYRCDCSLVLENKLGIINWKSNRFIFNAFVLFDELLCKYVGMITFKSQTLDKSSTVSVLESEYIPWQYYQG